MKVLFLCTGNSCRSQIAEAFGKELEKDGHRVFSAGTNPQGINPLTFKTMSEVGFDLLGQHSKNTDEVPVEELDLVVSMCGHAEDNIPQELMAIPRVHWPLEDPADAVGVDAEKLKSFARIRDDIKSRVESLFTESKGA